MVCQSEVVLHLRILKKLRVIVVPPPPHHHHLQKRKGNKKKKEKQLKQNNKKTLFFIVISCLSFCQLMVILQFDILTEMMPENLIPF